MNSQKPIQTRQTCTLYKREECIGSKSECVDCKFYIPAPNGKEHKKPGEATPSTLPGYFNKWYD